MSNKNTITNPDIGYSNAEKADAQTDESKQASSPETLKGLLERINRIVDVDLDKVRITDSSKRTSQFDELVVQSERSEFSLPSQWDSLDFRNTVSTSGSGSVISNSQGEYEVKTGTTSNSDAKIVSNEAGIYEPGSAAVAGLSTRSLQDFNSFENGDEILWGLYDDENGFGFGIDDSGLFIFYRRDGSDSKTYRSNWEGDPIDGSGDSGFEFDPTDIQIFDVEYTWYGAGRIAFYLCRRSESYNIDTQNRIFLHEIVPNNEGFEGPSILQPDLPFTVETKNGGTNDVGVSLTGRSFRLLSQKIARQRRSPSEMLTDYTNLTQGSWVPVFGIRKKDTFNGFPNQINVRFSEMQVLSDEDISVRLEIIKESNIDSNNSTFTDVPNWGSNSCVQTAKGGNIETTGTGFVPKIKIIRGATGSGVRGVEKGSSLNVDVPIGRDQAIIVSIRQDTSNTTTTSLVFDWFETF